MWSLEDNTVESVLPFHIYMGSGDWIQVFRLRQQAPLPDEPACQSKSDMLKMGVLSCSLTTLVSECTHMKRSLLSLLTNRLKKRREKIYPNRLKHSGIPFLLWKQSYLQKTNFIAIPFTKTKVWQTIWRYRKEELIVQVIFPSE